jgi:hypothetical protein
VSELAVVALSSLSCLAALAVGAWAITARIDALWRAERRRHRRVK